MKSIFICVINSPNLKEYMSVLKSGFDSVLINFVEKMQENRVKSRICEICGMHQNLKEFAMPQNYE